MHLIAAIGIFVLFIVIPLMYRRFVIWTAAIFWTIMYIILYRESLTYDPSEWSPWWYGDVTFLQMFSIVLVISSFGLIRGLKGMFAILILWGPLLMLPVYFLHLGTGAVVDEYTYKRDRQMGIVAQHPEKYFRH